MSRAKKGKVIVRDADIAVSGPTSKQRLFEVESTIGQDYCEFMTSGFACTQRNRSKAIGQFLTPAVIYQPMIQALLDSVSCPNTSTLKVVDPFCGDGRLLVALLDEISRRGIGLAKVEVFAWDIDDAILASADQALTGIASRMSFDVELHIEKRDSFSFGRSFIGSFDVCVTNPPWSSTKSLKQDSFKTSEEYQKYQDLTNAYGRLLVEDYPEVKGGKSFGAGALNLSRFGLALSMRLIKAGGACGIVMPSSFAADTSSASLRKSLVEACNIDDIRYYPAELKLFTGADQAAITVVFESGGEGAKGGRVTSYMRKGEVAYMLDEDFWAYSRSNDFLLPLGYSQEEVSVIQKLSSMPKLGDNAAIRLGREVDETRIAERLCPTSPYRFVKGFMVSCYALSNEDVWHYDPSKAPIPITATSEKVVWRDVSRVSQKKRVQATLLPPGHVAGNSLGVATCANPKLLRALLGVMNSSVFEFMARTVLTTNHVSSGMLKRLPFPSMSQDEIDDLASAVDDVLAGKPSVTEIENLVALAYGLTAEELATAQSAINSDGQAAMDF